VQVHCDEGVASHIGPERAQASARVCEASVGAHTGQAIEPRKSVIAGADADNCAKGNTGGCATASIRPSRWS